MLLEHLCPPFLVYVTLCLILFVLCFLILFYFPSHTAKLHKVFCLRSPCIVSYHLVALYRLVKAAVVHACPCV